MNRVTKNGHFANDRFAVHEALRFGYSVALTGDLKFSINSLTVLFRLGIPILVTAFLLSACTGPYSALDPAGPAAYSVAGLWWGMFIFSTLVTVGVVGLWVYAMRRNPAQTTDAQTKQMQRRFIIGGGLVLPTASIVLLLIIGVPIGQRMQAQPGDEVLFIDVTGHQWWWEVSYPGTSVTLQNTLHIPVGTPINIHLHSNDVIHSFWVPRLAGKLDAVPGRTNILRLQADETGSFYGLCAEFCGLQHTHMRFTVEAHTPEDFDIWLREMRSNE